MRARMIRSLPPNGRREMSSSLDETAAVLSEGSGGTEQDDEQRAIALAQASIDGHRTSERAHAADVGAADDQELEKLSIALELIGSFGVEPLVERGLTDIDGPLKIGRYEIIAERGRGGFGIVLRALDPLLQREVALKIPKPERLLAGQALDELVGEARVVAKLSHPGIIRVHEVRRWGPLWYIASDYCDGPTLAEWLEGTKHSLSLQAVVEIMAATADAVHYAHSRGVLHLDLKPENILLDLGQKGTSPRPMVTDFGLSHGSDAKIASQGRIGGTLPYMAPEQKARDGERIGVATDVYALGIILGELTHAAYGSTSEVFSGEGAALSNWPTQTPRDIAAVCQRCLAADPAERYQSAQELADDLRRYLHGEPVTARPLGWPLVAAYYCRRKPLASTLTAALAATLIVSVVAVIASWRASERHLASLLVSKRLQQEAAERMEKSLLRLATFAQEAKLRMAHAHDETGLIFPNMKEFLLEARRWADAEPNGSRPSQGVEAAVKSMSLVDEETSDENSSEQFHAGLKAWLELIRHAPQETRWRQALALHLFTYKLREADGEWLSWRSSGLIPDESIRRSLEAPYALLLIDYARTRLRHLNATVSYGMLASALAILRDERNAPALDAQQRFYWELMAHQLAATAAERCWRPEASAAHLAAAAELMDASPPPSDCDARLAALIGETLTNQGKRVSKTDDEAAQEFFERASTYGARAVEAAPGNWLYLMAFVDQRRRLASLHRRNGRMEDSVQSLNLALTTLEDGLARSGNIRQLLRERAVVLTILAEDQLQLDNRVGARQSLERAIPDFVALELTSRDAKATWLVYGRALLTLAKLHANEGRSVEGQETYQRLVGLAAQMQSFTSHPRMQSFVRQAKQTTAVPIDTSADEPPSL